MSTRSFRGSRVIRFGAFELDLRAAELRKEGIRIRLQEQPFRILTILLERPGEVVLRDEIRRRLWPNDTVVEVSHGINAAVQRLRDALGDSADTPRYVETVARRGYRFVGPVERDLREPRDSNPPSPLLPRETADWTGKSVLHYQVTYKVGGGGMGVVYHAVDRKLGRPVALKVLPQEMAGDALALERFRREARAASALNHPNICTVYAVDDYESQPVIVMELLEGQTLEALLAKGRLPLDRALALAIPIATALDAAHRKGIVHRDLKPANVMVTPTGVKVLDFGLAKMDRSLPWIGGGPVTERGSIMGTLHYMSPEQVQGNEAGAASDIFSFGLLLYEMLTGRRAFEGENTAAVMAAILTAEMPALPASMNSTLLTRLLRRCLAKDPAERWQSARDLQEGLEWIAASGARHKWRLPFRIPGRRVWTGAAAAAVLGGLLLLGPWVRENHAALVPQVSRLTIAAPGVSRLNLSPDGKRLAFVSRGKIHVRSLDSPDDLVLGGTDNAGSPFWSPDGQSIAFLDNHILKAMRLTDPMPRLVSEVNTNLGGTWGRDGNILIGQIGDGIFRVPASGGTPERLTSLDAARGETRHLLPQSLPGGDWFLFVAATDQSMSHMLFAASPKSGRRVPIMPVESTVTFVAPDKQRPGYLVFVKERTILAQPFDPVALRTVGPALPVGDSAGLVPVVGAKVQFADVSAAGPTLAWRRFPASPGRGPLMGGGEITVVKNWTGLVGQPFVAAAGF